MTDKLKKLIAERDYHAQRSAELSHRIHVMKCAIAPADTPNTVYDNMSNRDADIIDDILDRIAEQRRARYNMRRLREV